VARPPQRLRHPLALHGEAAQRPLEGHQGRERSRTFDRKIDAERFIAGQETAKAKGEWLDPASARTRVNEFVPGWLDTKVDVGHQSLLNKGTAPKAHPALLWADAV